MLVTGVCVTVVYICCDHCHCPALFTLFAQVDLFNFGADLSVINLLCISYLKHRIPRIVLTITVVGEQPYKSRDMVGSDSGLGHLLGNTSPKQSYNMSTSKISKAKMHLFLTNLVCNY